MESFKAMEAIGHECSVVGIPKTIDNDIPIIDRSFGFETAVAEATHAIDAAQVEVNSFPNSLAVVKVMGRHSGFIAVHACLAARNVDLCLVPEQSFYLEGPGGVLDFVKDKINTQGHALVVVAEGAGQDVIARDTQGDGPLERDVSGNIKFQGDIGQFLANKFKTKLAQEFPEGLSMKYIDPTYMVRAVAANPADNIMCAKLADSTVHGVMYGYTNFMVGTIGGRAVLIPLSLVVARSNVVAVSPRSRTWNRLRFMTGQPTFETGSPEKSVAECDIVMETLAGGCTPNTVDTRQ
eukprot:gnl/TRDRNA2_/TRDRNA2_170703_c3_seq3.p1 gnl/TRDRNA2_/TRDRNA2_170703_c3~~gnl/TRDRNA2_/TRDRNA2_170703_c3_seq3.p1  ORF type:complete len:332 (-),score=68.45 gnl/TRDRNA2_/TRDRNA2_170703_c3_seq3:69-950(-)